MPDVRQGKEINELSAYCEDHSPDELPLVWISREDQDLFPVFPVSFFISFIVDGVFKCRYGGVSKGIDIDTFFFKTENMGSETNSL